VGGLLPRLVRAIGLVTEAEGFNVVINNGRAAGQTVFHGHWHIIPRFTGDRVHWPWPHGPGYSADERAQIQARLQAALASSQAPASAHFWLGLV
jgi:histidine triad (HIT) family protein